MARREPWHTDEQVLEAIETLWDAPEMRHIKGALLVREPDAYAAVSWGVARRQVQRDMKRVRRG